MPLPARSGPWPPGKCQVPVTIVCMSVCICLCQRESVGVRVCVCPLLVTIVYALPAVIGHKGCVSYLHLWTCVRAIQCIHPCLPALILTPSTCLVVRDAQAEREGGDSDRAAAHAEEAGEEAVCCLWLGLGRER